MARDASAGQKAGLIACVILTQEEGLQTCADGATVPDEPVSCAVPSARSRTTPKQLRPDPMGSRLAVYGVWRPTPDGRVRGPKTPLQAGGPFLYTWDICYWCDCPRSPPPPYAGDSCNDHVSAFLLRMSYLDVRSRLRSVYAVARLVRNRPICDIPPVVSRVATFAYL